MLAGMWYPATEARCIEKIKQFKVPEPGIRGRAGIVPHAGWEYSGAVAFEVFQALAASDPKPELVVLFGTHMAPNSRPHISRATSYETPFGPIRAAEEIAAEVGEALELRDDPADSKWGGGGDNTVEVQLPFIKYLLPDARLVVIGPPANKQAIDIGKTTAEYVKKSGIPAAIVGSTDLTHYGARFGFAPKGYGEAAALWVKEENDACLIQRILAFDAKGVLEEAAQNHNACVPGAVAAAMSATQTFGATQAKLLKYTTSYDNQPSDTFVGYAGVIFHE